MKGYPDLINGEKQKIERLTQEIEVITASIIPLSQNTLKILEGIIKQPKTAASALNQAVSDFKEAQDSTKNHEIVSAILIYTAIFNDLLKNIGQKSFNRVSTENIKKVKLTTKSYQQSKKNKASEISESKKNIEELHKQQKALQKKVGDRTNIAPKGTPKTDPLTSFEL